MPEFTLLLGANQGEPHATFALATTLVLDRIGPVLAASRDHWTTPWGFQDERLFLNRALLVATQMEPKQVMEALLQIESELGRVRPAGGGYSSRIIDIDILFIGEQVIQLPGLTVPHPRVHLRAFALGPAADIVPGLVHPLLHRNVLDLLNTLLQQP